jgi:hypothetical protein
MEVDVKKSTKSSRTLFAIAAVAALVCASARAEYRCDEPAAPEDKRACELAKQGPDELRQFIQRTSSIYGLYFYDYVTAADFDRWQVASAAARDLPKSDQLAKR